MPRKRENRLIFDDLQTAFRTGMTGDLDRFPEDHGIECEFWSCRDD